MPRVNANVEIEDHELTFRTSRSSGPGGQHVNTTESRVEVSFDVVNSPSLSEWQRARILEKLASRLTTEGVLTIACQDERSQHRNKEIAVARLCATLASALHVDKPRRKTRPTLASKKRRLQGKAQRSQTKKLRGKVDRD